MADVGCGHGASTIIMARAFPESAFTGFDYHASSIDAGRKAAAEAGVDDRVSFEVAPAKEYPGTGYDLVAFFDCLKVYALDLRRAAGWLTGHADDSVFANWRF